VAGARLVLVPDRRNRIDLFKAVTSDASGHFLVRNIPHGDYRVFGWEALEANAYFDPDLLRRSDPFGVPLRISDSSSNSITVRIIPANP
jgi:hypothetical protein